MERTGNDGKTNIAIRRGHLVGVPLANAILRVGAIVLTGVKLGGLAVLAWARVKCVNPPNDAQPVVRACADSLTCIYRL